MTLVTRVLALCFCMAITHAVCAQVAYGTLPLTISVDANLYSSNKVAVTWVVTQQMNTDCYFVERSNDGVAWKQLAVVKAGPDSVFAATYTQRDLNPMKGVNYYRINIRSKTGETGLTVVREVHVPRSTAVNLYPNPCSEMLTIALGNMPARNWNLSLYNTDGRLLLQKTYARGLTKVSIPVHQVAAGNYIVKYSDGINTETTALMINHR